MSFFVRAPNLCTALLLAALAAGTAHRVQAMPVQEVRADALTAWLVEEESPLVQLEFVWRHPPSNRRQALTFLTMALMEEAPAADGGLALPQALDALGAQWRARTTAEGGRLSLRMLAHNKDQVWALLLRAFAAPRPARAALARVAARAARLREQEAQTPQLLARRLWRRAVFPQHGFGASLYGTAAGMQSVRPRTIAAYHRRLFAQRNSIISAVGALSAAELQAWLAALAAQLPQGERQPPAAPWPLRWQRGGEMVQLLRAGPQTFIWFGLPGAARTSSDYHALQLLNLVLGGGGMNNRLMQEIREKRGLAYSAASFLRPLAAGSLWLGALASDNGSARAAYGLMQSELARLRRDGLTAAELAAARREFLGRFALSLRSGEAVAEHLLFLQLYGRPKDYAARLPDYLAAVTQADSVRVAQAYLDPAQLFAVAIGMSPNVLDANAASAP